MISPGHEYVGFGPDGMHQHGDLEPHSHDVRADHLGVKAKQAPEPRSDGAMTVLLVRLDTLEAAIRSRDWGEVERQYDRVLSAATKMAGTRGRHYDPPGSTS